MKLTRAEAEVRKCHEEVARITSSHSRELEAKQNLLAQVKSALAAAESASSIAAKELHIEKASAAQMQASGMCSLSQPLTS